MEDMNEYHLSEEEEEKLDDFFIENLECFIPALNENTEDTGDISIIEMYLHEDFKEACKISNREGVYTYTLIEEDGQAWIIDGWHIVNRYGYFFTTKKIDIPEEGLRYW